MEIRESFNAKERKKKGDSIEGKKKESFNVRERERKEDLVKGKEKESFNARERKKEIWQSFNVKEKERGGLDNRKRERHTPRCIATERRERVMVRERGGDLAEGRARTPQDVLQQRRQITSTPRRKRESLNIRKKERKLQHTKTKELQHQGEKNSNGHGKR
jgi:hypothetical protein